ncbi:Aldo_ket_red domain-containing protein, partial [Cephalotus follicularis]
SIGVSNYGTQKITELIQHATIPPAVNQVVEMNVAWQQQKLLEFCKVKCIHIYCILSIGILRSNLGFPCSNRESKP